MPRPHLAAAAPRAAWQRPFLKWAGGKYRLLGPILAALPPGHTLVEPFAGSAAVSLNGGYRHYLLGDVNADLINVYQALKSGGTSFMERAAALFTPAANRAAVYYQRRERFNNRAEGADRAALFVYLNRHGYNGLARYNSRGRFNVPFGRYVRPRFPGPEMSAFLALAGRVRLARRPFLETMDATRTGQVVYADPPYVPLSPTASFTAYSAGGFGLEDQEALAVKARELAARGVPVLISNHDTPQTRRLYRGARLQTVAVRRLISCRGDGRAVVNELLALFAPPAGSGARRSRRPATGRR